MGPLARTLTRLPLPKTGGFLSKNRRPFFTQCYPLNYPPPGPPATSPAMVTFSKPELEIKERKKEDGGHYYVQGRKVHVPFEEPPVETLIESEECFRHADYFQVSKLFSVKDLMEARVHLGHKMGSLDPKMATFVFGSRFDQAIIDLDKTAFHLRQALNFLAHIAYRKGIILFVTRSPQAIPLVERTAIECGEYAHCRDWDSHTLTNSIRKYGGITRLPDCIVLLNTLDTVMSRHLAVSDAGKMLIPTVGVVDTNCNPNLITFPIPGNDDSQSSIELFCCLFKEAIMRGKNKRKQVDALQESLKKESQENKPV